MPVFILYILTILVPVLNPEPQGLNIGDKAPDFIATNQNGEEVILSKLLEKGKVVLTFYRGAWCRYCMKQMKDYQDSLALISEKGATIIAISPEHEAGIQKTVEKAGTTFSLIRDKDLQIMLDYAVITSEKVKEYRKLSKETEEDISRKYVPVPALYIINQEGVVEFVSFDPDYKQRLSVEDLVSKL